VHCKKREIELNASRKSPSKKGMMPIVSVPATNPVSELGLLVTRGARGSAGENSGAESYHKNNRYNRHRMFLSSSGVNQMKNKIRIK
jgi:hypothetical protein